MADFGINSTQLSEAQGRGTNPLSPVQEQATNTSALPMAGQVGELISIFAKGLKDNAKEEKEAREAAIIGEYVANENKYGEAHGTGQWDASRTATASRANFAKFAAAHPGLIDKLKEARVALQGGTQVGEAERIRLAEAKQLEADIGNASSMGYQFFAGQSEASKIKTIEAYREARRLEIQTQKTYQANAEARAVSGEARAAGNYEREVADYVAQEQAVEGARTLAGKNFDVIASNGMELISMLGAGKISPEVALEKHSAAINNVKAGLNAIAGKFPQQAAHWIRLFDDMDKNIREQLDPSKKSESEVKLLKDRLQKMVLTSQLAAVERDPELLTVMAASETFRGDPYLMLGSSGPVKRWLASATGVSDVKAPPIIGQAGEKQAFDTVRKLATNLKSSNLQGAEREQAEKEMTSMIHRILEDTKSVDGSISPTALKEAAKFYASPEFGKMSLEGRLDKQTAAEAQHVFQVKYDQAVKQGVAKRLQDTVGVSGEPLSRSVDVKLVGGKVVFEDRSEPASETRGGIHGFIGRGMRGHDINKGRADVKEAEDAVNQLIRIHAHLEGTTDYASYWEKNKHIFMPTVFPDPVKLKPGTVTEDGYKYLGGNVSDRRNFVKVPSKSDGK